MSQIDRSWRGKYYHRYTREQEAEVIAKYGTKCHKCGVQLSIVITTPGRRQRDKLQLHHVESESGLADKSFRVDMYRPGCPDCNLQTAFEKGAQPYYSYEGDRDAYRWFQCEPSLRPRLERTLRYVPFKGWRGEDF